MYCHCETAWRAASTRSGWPVTNCQILNGAVLADDRGELHGALNARLLGERGIDRLNFADQVGLLDVAAHADTLRSGRLGCFLHGRRWRRGRGTGAQDSTMTPPGPPPGTPPITPPTTPALEGGGSSSSLILAISFGIDLGAIRLAGIELARNDLHNLGQRRRRWRRRRRRRRRRHQEAGELGARQRVCINQRNQNEDDDHAVSDPPNDKMTARSCASSRCRLRKSAQTSYQALIHPPQNSDCAQERRQSSYRLTQPHNGKLHLGRTAIGHSPWDALGGSYFTLAVPPRTFCLGALGPRSRRLLGSARRTSRTDACGPPENYARRSESDWQQKPTNKYQR